MNRQELFLVEEYKNASQLTFHIDTLRNKIISFFLTFLGIMVAGVVAYIKGDLDASPKINPELFIGLFILISWLLGGIIILILGRLRRVQIEHFRIINNIRSYFYEENITLWNVTQLSVKTLPSPNRYSGTYFWIFTIILVSSLMLPLSLYMMLEKMYSYQVFNIAMVCLYFASIILFDRLYLRFATPPVHQPYDAENSPFLEKRKK